MKQGDPYVVGTFVDEWGCVFVNVQAGVHGEVKAPALPDWDRVGDVRFPEELLTVDVAAVNVFCRNTDKFVIAGTCPRPFERLQFYRNSENLYTDLGEDRPEMLAFLKRLHEFYLKELEIWVKTEVDALMFMDDWGAQRALLISPAMWRRLFKPLYKDYIDIAHRHGKRIFMHSDGFITPIIGDLVELGLDALNCQLFTMDIEALGRQFAGKITFWGEIDRQYLLPSGTPADIDRAVRRVKDALWHDGGCIAQCEFGPAAGRRMCIRCTSLGRKSFDDGRPTKDERPRRKTGVVPTPYPCLLIPIKFTRSHHMIGKVPVGIIGCGNISPIYLQAGRVFEILRSRCCCGYHVRSGRRPKLLSLAASR